MAKILHIEQLYSYTDYLTWQLQEAGGLDTLAWLADMDALINWHNRNFEL